MLKRLITLVLALLCFTAFTAAQTVKVSKHDSTTIVSTVVNFKLETPKSYKADLLEIPVIYDLLHSMQKSDSSVLELVAGLKDSISTKNKCNSPPKAYIKYKKDVGIAYIIIVAILIVVIGVICFTTAQYISKALAVMIIILAAIALFIAIPEIIGVLSGFYSDS